MAGLRLLGFKPRSEGLRFHESAKHPYFIYPNEEVNLLYVVFCLFAIRYLLHPRNVALLWQHQDLCFFAEDNGGERCRRVWILYQGFERTTRHCIASRSGKLVFDGHWRSAEVLYA